jgi:queuine tRNA-ribosyltransferase
MTQFSFKFKRPIEGSKARIGELKTPHGTVKTPAFIFCATKAAIKGLTPDQMKAENTQFMLSNTYHLMIQPGPDVVQQMGGLHKFMGWDGPMLTDSGGYQIFSLGHGSVSQEIKGKRMLPEQRRKTLMKITEEGAIFRSYTDGSKHILTPEYSIQIQHKLGADLIVVLDECTPFNVSKHYTRKSMHMSHRWADRSIAEFDKLNTLGTQALYGIIQGGIYEDLRDEGTDYVNSRPFFGHAIGGSLGASKEQMYDIVGYTAAKLDESRPIHLLGIGGIRDVFFGVKQGIDTFDCVHPTRLARHGGALVKGGDENGREHLNLKNGKYRLDSNPIEKDCPCYTCSKYSRSYIHHLLKADELVGMSLITIHNVRFMNRCFEDIRHGIETNTLDKVEKEWLSEKS